MGGEEFLRYIYDELTHQIDKLLADSIVKIVETAPVITDWSAGDLPSQVSYPVQGDVMDIVNAYALLSDEVENPVIIMPKTVYATYVGYQAANNYAFDPFMGLPVIFTNAIGPDDAVGCSFIVGDLGAVQVNFPEGDGVKIKYDELSLAELDLVKIVGREYAAIAITAPDRFVRGLVD